MIKKLHDDFGPIFWLHIGIIFLFYLSPFLLDWRLVAMAVIAYYLEIYLVGDCLLSRWEFSDEKKKTTFFYHYCVKIWPRISEQRLKNFVDQLVPWILLALALVWQIVLGHGVAVSFFLSN